MLQVFTKREVALDSIPAERRRYGAVSGRHVSFAIVHGPLLAAATQRPHAPVLHRTVRLCAAAGEADLVQVRTALRRMPRRASAAEELPVRAAADELFVRTSLGQVSLVAEAARVERR